MFRVLFVLFFLSPVLSIGADMPPEVQKLQDAIESIPGVTDAMVEKIDLSDIPESHFSLPPYGDLPLGALRRTKGGAPNEVLIAVNFGISRDTKGLDALEFIAWWVRDAARGGSPIQIRALALPPIGDQFGTTLRFSIDYFYVDPDEDIGKLLATVGELADGLGGATRMFPQVMGR